MYPNYAKSERIADGIVHAFGVGFAIIGAIVLFGYALFDTGFDTGRALGGHHVIALGIYSLALIATFTASAIYHMSPWEQFRPLLRRIDHAAIFIKIAATYTPLVALIGSAFAWFILGVVWALALIGAGTKLFFWRDPGRMELALYLGLGWIGVLLIWPLLFAVPTISCILIGLSGLLYTGGVFFFNAADLKYANAIWHVFVLAASICVYAAIVLGIAPQI